MGRRDRYELTEEEAQSILALARKLSAERIAISQKTEDAIQRIQEEAGKNISSAELKRIDRNQKAAIKRAREKYTVETEFKKREAELIKKYDEQRKVAMKEAIKNSTQLGAATQRVTDMIAEQSVLQHRVARQISDLQRDISSGLDDITKSNLTLVALDAERANLERKMLQLQQQLEAGEIGEVEARRGIKDATESISYIDEERLAIQKNINASEQKNEESRKRLRKLQEADIQSMTIGLTRAEAMRALYDERAKVQRESLENERELASLSAGIKDPEEANTDEQKAAIMAENQAIEARMAEILRRKELLKEEMAVIEARNKQIKKSRGKRGEQGKAADKKKEEAIAAGQISAEEQREQNKAEAHRTVAAEWSSASFKSRGEGAIVKAIENMSAALSDFTKSIDDSINTFYQYQASINARLQGSDETYKDLLATTKKNIAMSSVVRQRDMVEKLKELVEKGVAYNVDLRAFLATVSDKIATTFDAFDANLLKIIRVQQADTTAARLGMEASLTKLFNTFFSDTSYLTDAFDTVSGAILEASSQLTRDASLEFEYIVQKWLGALYSVGLSDKAVATIAEGLNYLGTGNVNALNSNSQLQTLFAMSASRANLPYSDILTGGLSAETTNSLLKSMVEYLKSIAQNPEHNQVTRAAYTNMFGMSMADLRAINNLEVEDIDLIHQSVANYQTMMDELSNQFSQVSSRVHASQKIENSIDNAVMAAATTIGDSAGLYGTWKVLNIIEDLTGGIPIPMISVMGNTVDLKQTITGIAKLGIGGLSMMGSLMGSLFGTANAFDVNSWGYDTNTKRGGDKNAISAGSFTGISQSEVFGGGTTNSDGDAVKKNSLASGTEGAKEDSEVTNADVEENADVYEKIYEALADKDTTMVELTSEIKAKLYSGIDVKMGALDGLMDTLGVYLGANRVFFTYETSGIKDAASMFTYSTQGGLNFNMFSSLVGGSEALTALGDAVSYKFETTSNPFEMVASAINSVTNHTLSSSTLSTMDAHTYANPTKSSSLQLIMTNVTDGGLSTHAESISSLYNSILNSEKTSLNVEVKNPSTIDVNMKTIDKGVQTALLEALGDAFASAMGTGDGEDGQSFITALVDALTDVSTNIGVTVKNDGFDSMISSSNRP